MTKKIEEIADADLDNVTGADSKHDKWIDILSVSQGTSGPQAHTEQEHVAFTYDKITWTYEK